MNDTHRDCIAGNLVSNLTKLLDGRVNHQVISDSYGKSSKRIVITYDESTSSNPVQ